MQSLFVVDLNCFCHKRLGDFIRGQNLAQQKLVFENAVDALGLGIFINMLVFRHADTNTVARQQIYICMTAVLKPTVRVMNELKRTGEL